MRPKKHFDRVLLEKALRQGEMTVMELSGMFELSSRKIGMFRNSLGIRRATAIKCTVCGLPKAPNCYRSDYPGICIICRREMGLEVNHAIGRGRPRTDETIRTARTKCLKCGHAFLTRLGYKDQKVNRICAMCTRTNSYLGDEETELSILYG